MIKQNVAMFVLCLTLFMAVFTTGLSVPPDDSAVDLARRAYEASDYRRALQILAQATANEPQNAEIQLWLARTYFEMQQNDAAIASAVKAVEINPRNSLYHEWLGKSYGQKAEQASWFSALSLARKTRKEFESAAMLDEQNFSAQQALIEFDCSAPGIAGGGEDKARAEIAKVARLDAAEGSYATGNCRRQKKDFATADMEFTKALQAAPKRAELIYDIGDYAMKREQPERLLAVAAVGEQAVPADPRAAFYRAVGLTLKKENLAKAEQLLRDYLTSAPTRTAYPSRAVAHHWLGRLLEEQGKRGAALQEYDAALKIDPKDRTAKEALKRLGKR